MDFGDDSGSVGRTVIGEESIEGGYAVYWRSQLKIGDFLRYIDELHKKGSLVSSGGFDPHFVYQYMQEGDERLFPSGSIDETFSTVEAMLEYAKQESNKKEGRLLRLDFSGSSYIWDDYKTPWLGLTIAIINAEGAPIDNVIELFRLSFPEVDEELVTMLNNEPPPIATSSRQ